MPGKKIRIILDTNLWISFILTNDYSRLDTILRNKNIQLLVSIELLEEFIEVAQRPKFRKYFSGEDLSLLVSLIEKNAEIVAVKGNVQACRDPKDNFLLSLALDGKATRLITGDKDLLVLNKFRNTKILTIQDFLN